MSATRCQVRIPELISHLHGNRDGDYHYYMYNSMHMVMETNNMNFNNKNVAKKNYTSQEENHLARIIHKYKSILECKDTDNMANRYDNYVYRIWNRYLLFVYYGMTFAKIHEIIMLSFQCFQ